MLQWFAESWLSCRKYTERASRNLDQPLTGWDRAGFVFHHYFCFFCRRFNRQIHQLEGDLKRYSQYVESQEIPPLPEQARQRIIEKLRNKI